MKNKAFEAECLKRWFYAARRELPWRENPSPYAVWISEVMLQQTQVSVVVPYFKRWMERFPSAKALAEAPLDEVIKVWEGLGYYSRARNLHEGARYVMAHHGGELPEEAEELKKIKGLGPYTVGAIQSFAFKRRAAAVDGNVLRVMSRYYSIETPIDQPSTRREIEKLTESILPGSEPWILMEALIELGALVCKKHPECNQCPLKESCLAYEKGLMNKLPVKGKKVPTTFLYRFVAVIQCEKGFLIRKEKEGKVMAGLWEFPYFESGAPILNPHILKSHLESALNLKLDYLERLPEIVHGFTRFKAFLYPYLWKAKRAEQVQDYVWVPFSELLKKPFSSGHRRILKSIEA